LLFNNNVVVNNMVIDFCQVKFDRRKVKIFNLAVLHDFLKHSLLFLSSLTHESKRLLSLIFFKKLSVGDDVDWKRLLAYISGTVDQ